MANIFDLGDDWTESGTVYDAIKIDVTDTASDATSKLLDLQIGGTSKFKVDKGGNVTLAGSITGLDQVDNTSDLDKPVSTLQATAIGVVQTDVDNHEALTNNPHTVTAAQVGLGNVDNTSDLDKPVSTLQATAIGVVQTDVDNHEALTNNPHTVTAAQVGLGNVDNTSDLDKPVSTLTQAAIDAAGGGSGAFSADANTLITASTPIVLDQATGDEAALTLDYTTNKAAGNDTGLLINQTDTLSPGTSKLLDLQVGGSSKFNVDSVGTATSGYGFQSGRNSTGGVMLGNAYGFYGLGMGSQGRVAWGPASPFASPDLVVLRDAAGTLGQRNGVNAQAFNIYNTYTSATAFERGFLKWDADTFVIGTEAGSGGGTGRHIKLTTDSGNYVNLTNGGVFYMNPGLVQSWQNRSRIDSPSFGVLKLADSNNVSFGRLQLGGVSTSFPAIKRSGANIHLRLADDSAFTGLSLADLEPSGDITHTGSNVGFYGVSPTAQAAHIADATNATDVITRVNAILVALENIGITAAV